MKKITAILVSLTLTAVMLSSCGNSDDTSQPDATPETTTTTTATQNESESTSNEEEPKPITEIKSSLKNYENASVKFSSETKISSFIQPLGTGYNDDESHLKITLEDLDNVPMIRVQTLDQDSSGQYKAAKVHIDISKFFKGHTEDLPKIYTVKADIVTKAEGYYVDDKTNEKKKVPGNFIGKFVTQPSDGNDGNSWNELETFEEEEWVSEWGSYEITMKPGNVDGAAFLDTDQPQYIAIMKWSMPNQADFYIADLVFEDVDGNVIACADFK